MENIEYHQFYNQIVELIKGYQVKAVQAVQYIANQLYWEIGS